MISRIRSWSVSMSSTSWLAFLAVGFLVACFALMTHSSHNSVLASQGNGGTCHAVELNFDPGVDVHALENFKLAVADVLKQERFEDLDCTADQLRSSRARFAGGMWQLQALFRGLEDPWVGHTTELDWQNYIERLKRWVKAKPQSITARVALAEAYGAYAWDARGDGTSDTVSETGWDLFKERLEKSKDTLDEASSLEAKCPEWYVGMETVARGQGWSLPKAAELIQKAIEFEPGYYSSYGMHANFLLPNGLAKTGTRRNLASSRPIASAAMTATSFISRLFCALFVPATNPNFCACHGPESRREPPRPRISTARL